ncbi:hypothetical protein C5167_031771 [Papaver somniferum]|uniref:TF-B3 domain-containing protein n=1 Tax=Papaver somniferum TaxID=3469 RepID=A0A4Y7K8M2_PAPSO|nr:hypothetical protein C5167_031771 [Papaver somniferum]
MQGFDKSGRPTVVTYASKNFPNKEKGVVEEFKRKFSDLPSSQDNYQERLQKVYLVHVPSVFMAGWKLISPFIDSNTGKKHIPSSFAKKHLPENIKNVMVRNSDNKVWTIGYPFRGYRTHLAAGWSSLRRNLGISKGDVCVFELLKEKDAEMRVSVFREIDNVITRL